MDTYSSSSFPDWTEFLGTRVADTVVDRASTTDGWYDLLSTLSAPRLRTTPTSVRGLTPFLERRSLVPKKEPFYLV